jgi:hypothetical protein
MMSVGTPQWRDVLGSAEIVAGHDDNFDEWSSAWISFVTLNADWRPTEQLRVNGRYLEQRFHRVSDGSLVRLRMIPRMKVEYQERARSSCASSASTTRTASRAARRLPHERPRPDPQRRRLVPPRRRSPPRRVPRRLAVLVPAEPRHGPVRGLRCEHGQR